MKRKNKENAITSKLLEYSIELFIAVVAQMMLVAEMLSRDS